MTKKLSSINSTNAGISGATGSVWYNGSTVPSNSSGNNGDYYLNDSTGDVYNKVSGAWTVVANIKGTNGSSGSTISWQTISNNYTASNGDCLFVDTSSAALTVTLPASPSIGWIVTVQDPKGTWGTNNLTIHSVSEEINYQSSDDLILDVSDGVTLLYSGESWVVSQGGFGSAGPAGSNSIIRLATMTANNSTEIVFTDIPGSYTSYIITFSNVTGYTDTQSLYMRYSIDNGVTFNSSSDYIWEGGYGFSGGNGGSGSSSDTGIKIMTVDSSANFPSSGKIELFQLGSSNAVKSCIMQTIGSGGGNVVGLFFGGGNLISSSLTTSPVNAIQLFIQTSNFYSGTFALYGVV